MGRFPDFAIRVGLSRSRAPPLLLDVFGHLAALEAGRADHDPLGAAVYQGANPLKIGHKAPFGNIMSMGNVVSKQRSLPANFACFRHLETSISQLTQRVNLRIISEKARVFLSLSIRDQPLPWSGQHAGSGSVSII